jgi:transcriptional regulator with XRE-family HTH domain
VDADDDAHMIGRRVRRIRHSRGKSLVVIAGLAGMSKSELSRIERGETALDSLSKIIALANALQIAPSELMRLPVPAPANGHTDSAVESVRLTLDAIDIDRPGGLVVPVEVLRDRVAQIHQQRRACQTADVAVALPGLIRDLHTTLGTGRDHGELLDLAVYLHTHVTRWWLIEAAAPADLIRRTVFLARHLAQERDEIATLALATFGVADVLLSGGAFDLGQAELDSLTLPPTTADNALWRARPTRSTLWPPRWAADRMTWARRWMLLRSWPDGSGPPARPTRWGSCSALPMWDLSECGLRWMRTSPIRR